MNCISCGTSVSPNFVFAIKANNCPACGQVMLDHDQHQDILVLAKHMKAASLNLTDDLLIKISASLHSVFNISKKIAISQDDIEVSEDDMNEEVPGPSKLAIAPSGVSFVSLDETPIRSKGKLIKRGLENAKDRGERRFREIRAAAESQIRRDASTDDLEKEFKDRIVHLTPEEIIENAKNEYGAPRDNGVAEMLAEAFTPTSDIVEQTVAENRANRAKVLSGKVEGNKFGIKPIARG